MTITVALIHMRLKPLAKKSNLEKARKLVRDAALKGANLAVLPSFVNTGPFFLYYPRTRNQSIARNQAERIPGSTYEYLSMMAIENGIYIVAGPIVERAGPKMFLTTLIIMPNGALLAKYRKIAPNIVDEDIGISPGREIVVFNDAGRAMGLLAEDDIYYPEIARALLLSGATAMIATLRPGEDVNKVKLSLLARSIENRVPILAVGGAFETVENVIDIPTMVIDPQNGIVEEINEPKDTFLLVEVMDKPSNMKEIIEASLKAKTISTILCKAAKESLVENLVAKFRSGENTA
ncbi:carbon-nitrogen hydrolase family protein [Pyrofollis japonicus]|uniref:carbon-nitrogen hydrolase family protein n=1 Tax=Pyrofollis japonicus TaxID=3060460 RepID=UPI00295C0CB8|nr:carbon-nitrogen hydrolase family protein [Pyrofollis japonicus]BEP18463.1 carbon-nitrogen hydrolase family protein [Pyrofollis japonicus]